VDIFPRKRTNSYYDPYRRTRAVKITPGEYCVVSSGAVIVTVLGSCVTACIRDRRLGIGGMNHFMIANINETRPFSEQMLKMANAGMDKFLGHLYSMGAEPESLEAKIFGGGHILNGLRRENVGARSAQFLNDYLAERNIPVVAQDLLDIYPRKVYFFPETGEVLVKKLKDMKNETVLRREQEYSDRLFAGQLP
jgi:chemotaxis protein CheD